MKQVKITIEHLLKLGRTIPKSKHIACPARTSVGVVSEYTRAISYKNNIKDSKCQSSKQ